MLEIETGRHNYIERDHRKCKLYSQDKVEDELHFILDCDALDFIRKSYIPNFYLEHTSFHKLVALLSTNSSKLQTNIARYIIVAFEKREKNCVCYYLMCLLLYSCTGPKPFYNKHIDD